MKKQTFMKSTLCLLMALVCNVAWAQTSSWFKMGASTTSLSDGDYVLVAKSDKGTGPVFYDPSVGKPYRYDDRKTVAEGHAVQSKYVWTIDETTIDGVQHITVTNHDDNTKAFPVDGAKNLNFTGSGTASLKTEKYTADGVDYIVLTLDDDAIGYVHANAPGGNPCLSYWPTNGDGASCIKFTFYPVDALTNEERLTYNVGDGKYNDRADSDWRNGWTSTNVGKPSFTISVGANNVNAGSAEYIGLRPGSGGCTYTLTLGETFTAYSFEAKSNNANPAHVVTINGKETTINSTEWTTVRADVVGTTASFGLKGSNGQDLYIRNVKFEQNAEVLAAATANANMDIYGLQRYLGLVQNANKYECNYPSNPADGHGYPGLLDGDFSTYFHSGYSGRNPSPEGVAHYLQADLGKAVKSFRFYTRKRNGNNRPTKITIEGSNDAEDWRPVTVVQSISTDFDDFYSEAITSITAYKHYRFTVNTTNGGSRFFTFSEFYILPNTPKVAETFDAVRGFRAGATVENATKLNEVYAWHQGFTGDAYPNDLYEGVYTLTINGPAAATATYNGESKALPATFYVTEEVAEENAAVTIASTESTLSFNCFSDETDTYETLTVTSLTENKVYTANFNYSLELKESTGRFTEGSKVWSLTTNAANPVALTFTSNANNMNHHGGYIQLHSGQAKSSTYTLTVPEGYIILEYSFDYAFGNTGTSDKKFVVGEQNYPVTAESQSLSVENVNATTTQFVLTGENQPVKVQNFIVKIKTLTAKEIIEAKKTALKEQVEGLRGQLKKQVGYYYCTINGVKMYDADAILAAINAASSAATVAEIAAAVNAKTPVMPEYGKAYKMAFKTKAGALHHIVANEKTLALSASTEANDASVFYCMQSNSDEYPYIFVSAEGGFLTFKALSDAYINKVTDFKVGLMTGVTDNVNSSVESRIGTVYIATNKRPNSDKEDDGCFVFKNQGNANTYDGANVPFHNDNYTSAIVMTEVAAESKIVYDIVVDGDDDVQTNAYVAYDNGTVVRKAFNDGYLVTDAALTEAQLKAGFVGNVVKSATITVENNMITLADVVVTFPTPVKQDLYNTSNGSLGVPPYRIPGITVDPETGRIITVAAELVCGTDPGYGEVDIVCRISDNNGDTWTDMIKVADGTGEESAERNIFETAFGDPAIVADRTSSEVLVVAVAGCTVYANGNTTRENPNMIATIHSKDNGETWETPVDVTEPVYSLFDNGNPIQSAFVGGGKIFQSRIVKVGQYYRLYAAMCARPNGNRVIYSDDFGRTWHALGGASALPAPGGNEPKCEELPDGRVILSSRVGGGRIYKRSS